MIFSPRKPPHGFHLSKLLVILFFAVMLASLHANEARNSRNIVLHPAGSEVIGLTRIKPKTINLKTSNSAFSIMGYIYTSPIVTASARNSSAHLILGPKVVIQKIAEQKRTRVRHWDLY